MSEQQLTNAIIQFLNYSGECWVWRVNSGMAQAEHNGKKRLIRLAKAGSSDIQGIRKSDGRFLAIEVKKPETRKTVTDKQQMFLDCVEAYNGISGVATTPEEALEIVQRKDL